MEIVIRFNEVVFEAAVQFIAKNNPSFIGKFDYVRGAVYEHMKRMAFDFDSSWSGTMGYIITIVDRQMEGIDSDINAVDFEIYVDPGLGIRQYTSSEYRENTITGDPMEGY
jgi:hypothetical protein